MLDLLAIANVHLPNAPYETTYFLGPDGASGHVTYAFGAETFHVGHLYAPTDIAGEVIVSGGHIILDANGTTVVSAGSGGREDLVFTGLKGSQIAGFELDNVLPADLSAWFGGVAADTVPTYSEFNI